MRQNAVLVALAQQVYNTSTTTKHSTMSLISEDQLLFKIPSAIIISGPSSSGKTTLTKKLLQHNKTLFSPVPQQIIYCYGEYSAYIQELEREGIQTFDGPPNEEMIRLAKKPFLLVIDDLQLTIDEQLLNNLFTKKSHHQNFGIIFICQNIFDKKLRIARQNSQYLFLMSAPNAVLQIRILGQQLFPSKNFMDAYNDATKKAYSYLLIDLHPLTDPQLRLRTAIFPDETQIVYSL
jgi:hypothetical protein